MAEVREMNPSVAALRGWVDTARQSVEVGRLARFGVIGVIATAVYPLVSLVIISTELGGPMAATVIGHLAAGVLSYLGHLRYSFRVEPKHRIFLWRFVVLGSAMLSVNVAITWLFTSVFLLPAFFPIAAVTFLIPIVNYVCSRFWVFGPGIAPAE